MTNMPNRGPRPLPVHGICVHTTGGGIPDLALKRSQKPLAAARDVYSVMGLLGPHACIAPDGAIEDYCDPRLVRHHVGLEAVNRRSYLDGTWEFDPNRLPPTVVAWWKARHPGVQSPSHLYPGRSPNEAYIGIELIPCGVYKGRDWTWVPDWGGTPVGFDGQRFSVEQYVALARRVKAWAAEFNLDLDKPGVLAGHEDLNPYTRPGWDPGDKTKCFSWSLLRGLIRSV